MVPAIIAAVASLAGVVLTTVGQRTAARRERELMLQELQILGLLDPTSEVAEDVRCVVSRRAASWHAQSSPKRQATLSAIRTLSIANLFLVAAALARAFTDEAARTRMVGWLPWILAVTAVLLLAFGLAGFFSSRKEPSPHVSPN